MNRAFAPTPAGVASSIVLSFLLASPRPAAAAKPASAAAATTGPSAPGETYAYLKDGSRVPLFATSSAGVPVATVGAEAITIHELTDALAEIHGEEHGDAAPAKTDVHRVLDRIIDLHLVAIEARAMGIDEVPEVKARLDAFKETALREQLRARVAATAKIDAREIERRYRDATREWKVTSVLFEKEADAKALVDRVAAGASFEKLAKEAVSAKRAKGTADPEFLPDAKMLGPVRDAVRKLKVGKVSRPVKVQGGFTVVRLEDVRYRADPPQRARIESAVAEPARKKALLKYYEGLEKRYARIDRKLLASVDFAAAKPGVEALLQDNRALATIEGEKPITVGDLTREVAGKLFHPSDREQSKKRLNQLKARSFEDILQKRLFTRQARLDGIQETDGYKYQLAQLTDPLLVGAFVEKAIVPGLSVSDDECKRYHDQHRGDFTTPETYRLEALQFAAVSDAQVAYKKAKAGTDFRWLATNASGQLPEAKRSLDIEGRPRAATELAPGLAKVLAGAKEGEYRLYGDGDGQYVIHVLEQFPPRVQPFDGAKAAIRKKLFDEKLDRSFKEYVAKLRKSQRVEVLLTRIDR